MLPIAKHRTMHVPHRLAVVAAVVCLGLSFAVDRSMVEERLQAEQGGGSTAVEQAAGSATNDSRSGEGESAAKRQSRDRNLSLLPWFTGLRSQ